MMVFIVSLYLQEGTVFELLQESETEKDVLQLCLKSLFFFC